MPMLGSRSEKTQRGNPHELALRQHIYPCASINRFTHAGGVDLIDLLRGRQRRARARDGIFCADRAWSHGAETGFMKTAEDAFQTLVTDVVRVLPAGFGEAHDRTITEFYALWRARAHFRHLSKQRIVINGVTGTSLDLSDDDLERLEKANIVGLRGDGTMAMRDMNVSSIVMAMQDVEDMLRGVKWGLLRAETGEFVVPDYPMHAIVPITPSLALVANAPDVTLTACGLADLNRMMISGAREYLFARSLDDCPGYVPFSRLEAHHA